MRSPEQSRRREVRVTFEGGKTLEAAINGTEEEIVRYYKDNSFNVGVAGNDDMRAVTSVEFIDAQPGMS
ncbi:hypothetical protein ACUVZD_000093 [Pseudomonas aeruginosa]